MQIKKGMILNKEILSGWTDVQISAGLTNISGLAVAAFDLINFSPSVARFALVFNIHQ